MVADSVSDVDQTAAAAAPSGAAAMAAELAGMLARLGELTDTATTILQNSVTVIAAFVAMLLLSWQLTLLTLILIPLFLVVQVRVGRRRQRIARRTQESLSEMTAITEDSLSVSGILLAKVFGRGHAEVERYRQENHNQTRLQIEAAMTGRTFFALVQTFFAVTPALIYLVAGYLQRLLVGARADEAGKSTGTRHVAPLAHVYKQAAWRNVKRL